MTEASYYKDIDFTVVRNPELLPNAVDFQASYTAAVTRVGINEVHRRDPSEPRDIFCMDEGLTPRSMVTVRLAGPVPLLARTLPILREKAAAGVVYGSVFDHDRCGALGLNIAALGEGIDINPQKAGEVLARRFAKELTGAYDDHEVVYGGRLPLTRRPADKHTGQTVYYDARQSGLDVAHLEEFAPGYTVSRGIFGPDASREYTGLAIGIALGPSGLQRAITPDTPLHLVGIADGEQDTGKIADELALIRSSRGQDSERITMHVITAQQ